MELILYWMLIGVVTFVIATAGAYASGLDEFDRDAKQIFAFSIIAGPVFTVIFIYFAGFYIQKCGSSKK